MHLAILQCDHVHPDLMDDFGDYPEMFKSLLLACDPELEFSVYDLTAGEMPDNGQLANGWLITGSKYSTYDPEPWIKDAEAFVRHLYSTRSPTVGICFGHQLIAQALSGKVERATAVGWGVGVHSAQVQIQRQWMQPAATTLPLLVSHQDQVTALPAHALQIAGHDFCPIDMFEIDGFMLGMQGHPEFSPSYSRATMVRRQQKIGERAFAKGLRSLENPPASAIAAEWIIRFIRDASAPVSTSATTQSSNKQLLHGSCSDI